MIYGLYHPFGDLGDGLWNWVYHFDIYIYIPFLDDIIPFLDEIYHLDIPF